MKVSLGVRLTCAVLAGFIPLMLWADDDGPEERSTGAPGDKPMACASGGCHTAFPFEPGGPINVHGGSVTAKFSQGSTYTPGTPVAITVRVADPANPPRFGFQMTARRESDLANAQAGRFGYTQGTSTGVVCDNGAPRSLNGNCNPNSPVEFIEHTNPSPTGIWTFTWTPPATASGPVHFYMAGNAVNNNGNDDQGDHVYTNHYVLEPQGECAAGAPVIDKVISPKGYGARTDFAPNTWVEITGKNFSTTTRQWLAADFDGAQSPIVNDRVRVKINGKDAFVWYISPDQINANTPDNEGEGPMDVVVTNCTQSSAPYTLTQHQQAPGLLAADIFFFNGKQYVISLFLDGVTFVGDLPGFNSRPAKPGEVIVMYGVGFGATSPPIAAGTVPTAGATLVAPFSMKIGSVTIPAEKVIYAGLSPGSVGLYQFVIEVPNVADGDHLIEMRLGNELVPPEAYLTVKR